MVEYGRSRRDNHQEEEPTPRPKVKIGKAWAEDLCTVKDCYDGFVSREIKGYSVLFGCPVCDRFKTNTFPNTAIPTLKRWMGRYGTYTDEEMARRKEDRLSVVESIREQARRKIQFDNIDESLSGL